MSNELKKLSTRKIYNVRLNSGKIVACRLAKANYDPKCDIHMRFAANPDASIWVKRENILDTENKETKTEIQKYNEALLKSGYSEKDAECLVALPRAGGWIVVVEGSDGNWITTTFYKKSGEYAADSFNTNSLVKAIQYANDLQSRF
ncbi:MAG: hypothetical protein GY774_04820 [Planctomycetes bacterium]|nr:hypothetical protein [Planctomycetota bacterium]